MTPAGTVITNRAEISWFDTKDGLVKKIYSNIAEITVDDRYELDLERNLIRHAQASQPINLPHRLTNTGNQSTGYELQINEVRSDFGYLENVKVFLDSNGNGAADLGEPQIQSTSCLQPRKGKICYRLSPLKPEGMVEFVITGRVATTAQTGDFYRHNVKVAVLEDLSKTDTNIDRIDLIEGANLVVNMEASPGCGTPVLSDEEVKFTISFTNTGTKAPDSRILTIDGHDVSGAILEDVLPSNLNLLKTKPPEAAPFQSIVIVQLRIDESSDRWISFDRWNGTSRLSKIGLYVPITNMNAHESGELVYVLHSDKHLTRHTVYNEAGFNIKGNDQPEFLSNQVCTTFTASQEGKDISADNPNSNDDKNFGDDNEAEIRFLTPRIEIKRDGRTPEFDPAKDHFNDAPYYRLDNEVGSWGISTSAYDLTRDGVYIEVHSSSLNDHKSTAEIHTVSLTSVTGDKLWVLVKETTPNSGIFRSIRPIRLSSSERGNSQQCPSVNTVTPDYSVMESSCVLNSKENGSLRASINDPGIGEILVDSALIDPLGIVFDSAYAHAIAGAIVTIHNENGSIAEDPITGQPYPEQITLENGKYQFPFLYAQDATHTGKYYLHVKPPTTYSFPSAIPAITLVGNTGRHVNEYSYGKHGHDNTLDSGVFTLLSNSDDLVADIPLDPNVLGVFIASKSAASSQVSVGGMITYTVTLHNKSDARESFSNKFDTKLYNVRLYDTLPYGFRYVSGTAYLDGIKIANPQGAPGPNLIFSIFTKKSDLSLDNKEHTLTYRLRATAGAVEGDGVNTAHMTSRTIDSFPVRSNETSVQVKISQEGVLDSKGITFGKVYVDANCDGVQDGGEWPIGGVKLYMEDGTWVITDGNGQYSLYGVKPGHHVIKVDPITLPDGVSLKPTDNRHMADPNSRLIDLTRGEFHRADFVASCPKEEAEYVFEQIQARNAGSNDWMLQNAEKYDPNKKQVNNDLTKKTGADGDLSNGKVGFDPHDNENAKHLKKSSAKVNRGYSLMIARYGGEKAANKGINLLPISVRSEAFIYPMGDFQTVRLGFSLNKKEVLEKQSKLEKINLKSSVVTTIYERLPLEVTDRLESPNGVLKMPVPKQAVKHITKAQAKQGTWLWPQNEMSSDGRFMAVVRKGMTPTLMVNGKAVPQSQIGERIENKREKAQLVAWYGVSLEAGENTLKVVAKDPFGNERTLVKGVFKRPASAVKMTITPVSEELPADGGRSYLPVKIKLVDDNGYPARGVHFITLETSDGNWVERDIQDQTSGRQIRVVNGERTVHLRSSEFTGEIKIRASDGDLKADNKVIQVAALRPLLAVGIIEINAHKSAFDVINAAPASQSAESEVNGRGAIFMKGRIRGDAHLTLSYDSDKNSKGERFRDINPNAGYPVFGDDSQRGYEAQSRSKVYAKIEKGRNSVMWGDFLTDSKSNHENVGKVQRSLTGANAVLDNGKTRVQIYGAEIQDNHITEEIRGLGIALNYHTDKKDIIRNSEVVEVVTYSRDNPGITLSSRSLTRFGDYTLDNISGELSFSDAIPAQDDQQNPVYIRISYDVEEDGKDYLVGGVRLNHQLTDELNVGMSHAQDEHETEGKSVTGVSAEYKTDDMTITGSIATIKHKDGEKEDGSALRLSANKKWNNSAESRFSYGRADEGFDNRSGGISADREELRLTHRQRVTKDINVNVEALHSKGIKSDSVQQSVGVTADVRAGDWTLKGGMRHIEQKNSADSASFNTVIVGAKRPINIANKKGSVSAEYEQDIGEASRRRISVGGDLQVHEKVSIFGRAERTSSLTGSSGLSVDQTQDTLAVGIKSQVMESTEVFSEYRLRGAINARDMETASGIRGNYEIEKGLSVSPRLEVVNSIKGNGKSSVAVSVGAKDTRDGNSRKTGRIEYRHDDDRDYVGAEAAYVGRLDEEWSVLARDSIRVESPDVGDTSISNTLTVGLSKRSRLDNKHNMLFYYQNKLEQGRKGQADCNTNILSTHQNYSINEDMSISGRLGGKVEECKQGSITSTSDAVVMDGRYIWDISSRWDADIHGGILATDFLSEKQYSAGLGVNYLVRKNLRIGGGYNFRGFTEDDLDSEGYNKQGVYVGLQYKVDENSFNWLSGEEAATTEETEETEEKKEQKEKTSKSGSDIFNQVETETTDVKEEKGFFSKVSDWFSSDKDENENNKND